MRARLTRALVVRVHVIDLDDQTCICHVDRQRRIEMVLRGDAMQPDGGIAGTNLTVDGLALPGSLYAPRAEPEGSNQEIMRARDVLIREERNDAFDCRHELLRLARHSTPG